MIWPETTSAAHLWHMAQEKQIKERDWIGHSLRESKGTGSPWEPSGKTQRTWRGTAAEETGEVGKAWKGVGALAQNRIRWRCFVEALCSSRSEKK
jgi:hypothetical protein